MQYQVLTEQGWLNVRQLADQKIYQVEGQNLILDYFDSRKMVSTDIYHFSSPNSFETYSVAEKEYLFLLEKNREENAVTKIVVDNKNLYQPSHIDVFNTESLESNSISKDILGQIFNLKTFNSVISRLDKSAIMYLLSKFKKEGLDYSVTSLDLADAVQFLLVRSGYLSFVIDNEGSYLVRPISQKYQPMFTIEKKADTYMRMLKKDKEINYIARLQNRRIFVI